MTRTHLVTALLALSPWAAPVLQAGAKMLFETDFSNLREWHHSGNTTTRSVTAPDAKGHAARDGLDRRNDAVPYRTELVMDSAEVLREVRNARFGEEHRYGFSNWLDDSTRDVESEILPRLHLTDRARVELAVPARRGRPPLGCKHGSRSYG